jgi:hypothetical protein
MNIDDKCTRTDFYHLLSLSAVYFDGGREAKRPQGPVLGCYGLKTGSSWFFFVLPKRAMPTMIKSLHISDIK